MRQSGSLWNHYTTVSSTNGGCMSELQAAMSPSNGDISANALAILLPYTFRPSWPSSFPRPISSSARYSPTYSILIVPWSVAFVEWWRVRKRKLSALRHPQLFRVKRGISTRSLVETRAAHDSFPVILLSSPSSRERPSSRPS
ncbi:hypothetical protein B0H12DRAFT_491114 [Mycena haematopus]|nr:hypothetical protein B0H12DRAFT_491114 [Mycena haematopus]